MKIGQVEKTGENVASMVHFFYLLANWYGAIDGSDLVKNGSDFEIMLR